MSIAIDSDEQREIEALDAYSRVVVEVAERLSPSVANLRVTRRSRAGNVPAGAGSAVVLTPDGFDSTHRRRSVAHRWDEIASITPVVVGPVPAGVTPRWRAV